jgi:hypothetical protein
MAPKQEMRQQSAQQQNSKGDDQWVAHGGSRCFRKPDHLAASPVMLCTRLILTDIRQIPGGFEARIALLTGSGKGIALAASKR